MIVRFGGLPSRKADPLQILQHSFELSKTSWKLVGIKHAGSADLGYRQSVQMRRGNNLAREEFDMELRLE
jgi:hypothetical protein